MLRFASVLLFVLFATSLIAQQGHGHGHNHTGDRAIRFPDTEAYLTLVCDFHQHTVFSDGSVWPDVRIQESLRDSVDAIAMTEHLEYQPHADDIPHPDRNRSNVLAEEYARPYDMIVIPGAEITRDLPPGHVNAIFIEDANKLLGGDSLAVFAEAHRQGAFTFWNHPNWVAQRPDGVARLTPFHRDLIERGWLHGIEVVNDLTISKEALQIALDHDLAIMGTSDIHGLIDYQFEIGEGGHRPVTLVLTEERSAAAIRRALDARRTVAWFENTLVGKEANVRAVVAASVSVARAYYRGPSSIADVVIRNDSDADYLVENLSGYSLQTDLGILRFPPHSETVVSVMTDEQLPSFDLRLRFLNAVTAPEERLEMTLPVVVE
ncbi:Sb-PDE family phosphodiesterase [Lewinella sp. JB7]|uniref:Sb-PDE family phosphodiesterase n=1 Tax=Lewinella sp. JB7 TaxID=2962887 RepID=UPI0020CA1272|nr:Sb-PDE family phosphodiesterase [Lewinella sp. JB7]MCP9237526.1 Sb-PDE family phosphodiesterase [Lewinella sp. JB7]